MAVTAKPERCLCGTKLSRYNPGIVCSVCERRYGDEIIRKTRAALPAGKCRQRGCEEPVTPRSAATQAPRWRNLCAEHYDQQRARNSLAARGGAIAAREHARRVRQARSL